MIKNNNNNNKTKKRNLGGEKQDQEFIDHNDNEQELEVKEQEEEENNDDLSFMDFLQWFFPMIHWGVRDWIISPIKFLFLYGYAMKWITFLSWYLSEDSETLIDLQQYQIVETEKISIYDINNFRYPTVMWRGEKIISQSFWCFWDPGHIIYCVLMCLFIILMTWFWKGLQVIFIKRMVDWLKRKVLENKKKIRSNKSNNKRKILKVGNKRINKKQKNN